MYAFLQPKYPFIKIFIFTGLIIGSVSTLLFSSFLLGFVIFSVFLCCGLLWDTNEPPTFPFCFVYQFAFVLSGYFFYLSYDYYPRLVYVGELELAILYSVIGLIIVMIGIKIAFRLFNNLIKRKKKLKNVNVNYYIPVLFWVVVVTNIVNIFVSLDPFSLFYSGSQFIIYTLSFRNVFVFLLFLEILHQRMGYKYGVAAFMFIIFPSFSSFFSDFKYIIFIVVVVIASQIKPLNYSHFARNRNKIIISSFVIVIIATFFLALYWEGGAKRTWRSSIKSGDVIGAPFEKANQFIEHFSSAYKNFDFEDNLENLTARLSSSVGYFSYVVERVPKVIPYEDGALTNRAIYHVVKPRILFPDKPALGGDSWLVRKYAGIWVAGDESDVSIGLGYIPEFYIDFGIYGIVILSLLYGFIVGLFYKLLLLASPSYKMYYSASSILLLNCFTAFEGEIAKLLGSLVMNFIIFFLLLKVIGKFFDKKILSKQPNKKKQYYQNRYTFVSR